MHPLGKYFCILIVCLLTSQANANCTLPVPDGGETPSPANLEGNIVSIKNNIVTIRSKLTKRKVLVNVSKNQPIYSVFGGDSQPSELHVGQKASVWFIGCKWSGKKSPEAAYFQILSSDPNDQP